MDSRNQSWSRVSGMLLLFAVSLLLVPTSHASTSLPSLSITTYSDPGLTTPANSVAPGGVLYVDVTVVDQSGNPVTVTCGQLQVGLIAPEGSVSAQVVYISVGHSDTASSFGAIAYIAPSEHGAQYITALGAMCTSSGYIALGTFTHRVIVHP